MENFARTAMRRVLTAPSDAVSAILPAWDPVDREICAVVERAQQRGELRRPFAEALVRVFFTLTNGLLPIHWLVSSVLALDDIPRLAVDYHHEGAVARGGAR